MRHVRSGKNMLHIFPSGTESMGDRGSKKAYTGPRTGIYLPTKFGCDWSIVVGCRSPNNRQTDRQTEWNDNKAHSLRTWRNSIVSSCKVENNWGWKLLSAIIGNFVDAGSCFGRWCLCTWHPRLLDWRRDAWNSEGDFPLSDIMSSLCCCCFCTYISFLCTKVLIFAEWSWCHYNQKFQYYCSEHSLKHIILDSCLTYGVAMTISVSIQA